MSGKIHIKKSVRGYPDFCLNFLHFLRHPFLLSTSSFFGKPNTIVVPCQSSPLVPLVSLPPPPTSDQARLTQSSRKNPQSNHIYVDTQGSSLPSIGSSSPQRFAEIYLDLHAPQSSFQSLCDCAPTPTFIYSVRMPQFFCVEKLLLVDQEFKTCWLGFWDKVKTVRHG